MISKGQEFAATLLGRVTDPSGAAIPNATVTIAQNGVNGASRTIQTDARGSYTATNLAAGNYTVTVAVARISNVHRSERYFERCADPFRGRDVQGGRR